MKILTNFVLFVKGQSVQYSVVEYVIDLSTANAFKLITIKPELYLKLMKLIK